MAVHRRLQLSEVGDVSVVHFVDRKILDEANIQELGQELFHLIEDEDRKNLLLNFSSVEFLLQRRAGQADHFGQKSQSARRQAETEQYPAGDLRSLRDHQVE